MHRIHRAPGRGALRALGVLAAAAAAFFAPLACAASDGGPPPAGPPPAQTVLLISLDGTTPEQLRDPALPTLARLRREGAEAERLVPVFPSNTFPNHVTFVTGVSPWRHGVVNNVFVDPERGLHRYENDPSWLQAEPLWSRLAAHGMPSAAFHWVGSQGPWTSGRGPRHWVAFDGGTPVEEKVAGILGWLELPDGERPRLVTSWFHGADRAGHRHGPGAEEVRRDLRRQDAALARLLEGLAARGRLATTALLLVSDHGMAPVERTVDLAEALDQAGVRASVLGAGGFATVRTRDAEGVVRVARGLGLEAWPRGATPPELPTDNPRFGDVVVVAPVGTALVREGIAGTVQKLLSAAGLAMNGSHGHRPGHPARGGILVAWGAGVPAGARLGEASALDVAPTVLALLGLPVPGTMEGRPLAGRPAAPSAVPSTPPTEPHHDTHP